MSQENKKKCDCLKCDAQSCVSCSEEIKTPSSSKSTNCECKKCTPSQCISCGPNPSAACCDDAKCSAAICSTPSCKSVPVAPPPQKQIPQCDCISCTPELCAACKALQEMNKCK